MIVRKKVGMRSRNSKRELGKNRVIMLSQTTALRLHAVND